MTNKTLNSFTIILFFLGIVFLIVGTPDEMGIFYKYFDEAGRMTIFITGLGLWVGFFGLTIYTFIIENKRS